MNIPINGSKIAGPSGEGTLILENVIGGGAFGDVYRARDSVTNVTYAVKFPRMASLGTQADVSTFLNEIMAAQEVQHPDVVRIIHVEVDMQNNPSYLVMEYLPDGTLQSRLEKLQNAGEQVSNECFLAWATALVGGMAAINEKILHRDLKPDNILMDGEQPKIGDFGLAKIVGAATRTLTFKGGQHLLYMAPEGWKNETNRIQLDMYSLGIVLYQIATLKYPYKQPSDFRDVDAFRRMHLLGQMEPLQKLRSDLPVGYIHMIVRLMEKRWEDRYENWTQVKEALKSSATPPTSPDYSVDTLLKVTEKQRHSLEKKRLADATLQAKRVEQRELDFYMESQLIETLQESINAFNSQSSLGSITPNWGASDSRHSYGEQASSYNINLPLGLSLRWHGFNIPNPLQLKIGIVRHAVCIKSSKCKGVGLHYLLCRTTPEDDYGKWILCIVSPGWPSPEAERRIAAKLPFDNADDIQEIAKADRAVHVIQVQYSDDIQQPFLDLVTHVMEMSTPN